MINKGVANALVQLIDQFCLQHNIISPIQRKYELNERIPLEEWFRILNYLNKYYSKNDLAIQLAKLSRPENIGLIAYLSMYCETIRDVFQVYARYQKVWYDVVRFSVQESADQFIFYWDNPVYIEAGLYINEMRLALMTGLSIFTQFMSSLVLPAHFKVQRIELCLGHSCLAEIRSYTEYFDCPITLHAQYNRIYFSRDILDLKIVSPNKDEYLKRILVQSADAQLEQYLPDMSFKELIYRSIVAAIKENRTDIHYVADKLGLKPRAIQNRLKQDNSTYSEQLAEVRKALAFQYLENATLSIGEIAVLLGYQEQASFHHTFKRWTGKSPRKWRLERGAA